MTCGKHGYPWPSLSTSPYHSSPSAGLRGYIPNHHIAAVRNLKIIKGFRTIVFIFSVISTKFRPICPPAFFRCLSNSGTFTELRTTLFIESSKETIIWRLQVQSWLQASNNAGTLNTCTRSWLTTSEQVTSMDSIKDVVRSSATSPYRSSLLAGPQGYTPNHHRSAVCRFELVVLLLLGHVKGSIEVHPLRTRPYFSSSVLYVWFV